MHMPKHTGLKFLGLAWITPDVPTWKTIVMEMDKRILHFNIL